ncbi:hypothetical protein ElyMa_000321000 [Elysia marginata]|uniref:Uncharacterized protein n=1 Tax=Elysia marginata TaxID=1093978 RepID=A0AAV4FB64_9GAST|nr:hypothetical protein ElyMa_000321000 [Elysia marginata]
MYRNTGKKNLRKEIHLSNSCLQSKNNNVIGKKKENLRLKDIVHMISFFEHQRENHDGKEKNCVRPLITTNGVGAAIMATETGKAAIPDNTPVAWIESLDNYRVDKVK